MKQLLEILVRGLVDRPDQIVVTEWPEEEEIVLELEVAPEDRGRVIGKRGRTADALRAVIEGAGRRRGQAYYVEILD